MHWTTRSVLRIVLFFAFLMLPLKAAVDVVKPEEVGLSSERLKRINEFVQRHIDAQDISGAITIVARRGRVAHFQVQGLMDVASKKPMSKDTIFRIASMSKPVVGVAIMMLVEEGKLRLGDPISRFIPEFKNLQVATPLSPIPVQTGTNPIAFYTMPANREMTIRDLLTHVSGLVCGPISNQEAAKIARKPNETLRDYIPRLGSVPLEFQPGTRWSYSGLAGFDTLGRVIEIVSGKSLDQFLQQRIFEPLGMKDTFFWPPENRLSRLATSYQKTEKGFEVQTDPDRLSSSIYFSGGGGLMSTAEDYLMFAQMLANGGQLNGKRLMSRRSVELMASVHAPDTLPGRSSGEGYGLSVRVISDSGARGTMLSNGSFGWNGAFGTHFWIDPKEQLVAILMIQTTPNVEIRGEFETAVMQAIIE